MTVATVFSPGTPFGRLAPPRAWLATSPLSSAASYSSASRQGTAAPDHVGGVPERTSDTMRHSGGAALAILQAMLVAKSGAQRPHFAAPCLSNEPSEQDTKLSPAATNNDSGSTRLKRAAKLRGFQIHG